MVDTKVVTTTGPTPVRFGRTRASETFAAVVVAAAAGAGATSRNISSATMATCQQSIAGNTASNNKSDQIPQNELNPRDHHQSRRNAWIKKRWKAAFHTVRALGNWKSLAEIRGSKETLDCEDGVVIKKKWHTFVVHHCPGQERGSICSVCGEELDTTFNYDHSSESHEYADEEDELCFLKCQYCQLVVHRNCVNAVTGFCSQAGQKPKYLLRKQKSTTPEEYAVQLQQQQPRFKLDEDEDDHQQQQLQGGPNPTVVVDPIYMALKEANRMATNRRVSVTSSPSPVGMNACSPRDLTPTDSMRELTVNRMAWCKMPSSASGTSYASSSGYGSTNNAATGSMKSLRNSPARMQSGIVSSTPSLVAQKSTESQETEFRRPSIAASSQAQASSSKPSIGQRRPPKLDSKMKSLSLDCPDAKVRSKGATASGYSPVGRRVLKVRPCKTSSFDVSDDGADPSSTSCSPCPSPYCGSTLTLPSSSYAVTHDYHAKFPEEIDLGVAERVFVFETGDPDWWQGQNVMGKIGIFPSTCVSHIHCNERVMQVVQNLNLWDGNKSLRLYRDQIVFAQQAEPDGLVEIRTEHDHRINCPIQYLMCLD